MSKQEFFFDVKLSFRQPRVAAMFEDQIREAMLSVTPRKAGVINLPKPNGKQINAKPAPVAIYETLGAGVMTVAEIARLSGLSVDSVRESVNNMAKAGAAKQVGTTFQPRAGMVPLWVITGENIPKSVHLCRMRDKYIAAMQEPKAVTDLMKEIGVSKSSVTCAIDHLRNLGLISDAGRISRNGKTVKTWVAV